MPKTPTKPVPYALADADELRRRIGEVMSYTEGLSGVEHGEVVAETICDILNGNRRVED